MTTINDDITIIAIIISTELYGEIAEDTHLLRFPLIELIIDTSKKVYQRQSLKPKDIEWDTYCEQVGISDWEEWVIAQARDLLKLSE